VQAIDKRRAGWIIIAAALLCAGAIVGGTALVTNDSLGSGWKLLVALVVMSTFALFIWTEVRHVRRCDELYQRIMLESLAIAFPATFAAFTLLELLRDAELVSPPFVVEKMWPLMVLLWVLAYGFARWRYQ
jgi:hypothetical protein